MKRLIIIFICFIMIINMTGCAAENDSEPISATHFCLDTEATITIFRMNSMNNASGVINECFLMCDEFEQKISRTIDSSEISKINSLSEENVSIDYTTKSIIQESLYFSKISNGAFDITIAPIVELWDIKNNQEILPSRTKIKKALSYVDYKKINVEKNSVSIPKNAKIDLGGIAKGYLADSLKEYMISKGVTSAIINLGGNILTIGKKDDNSNFTIGIQKPFGTGSNNYSAKIDINDKSVVTSGIYQRYFEKNGKIYHHIFDPKTGYPVENDLYSVTIISDSSKDGDALSTAAFVLGKKDGMKLINSLDNIEAVFIDSGENIILSDGLSINNDHLITIQ